MLKMRLLILEIISLGSLQNNEEEEAPYLGAYCSSVPTGATARGHCSTPPTKCVSCCILSESLLVIV